MIAKGTTISAIARVVDHGARLGNDLQANPLSVSPAAILGISQSFTQVLVSECYPDCSDAIWRTLTTNMDHNSGRPAQLNGGISTILFTLPYHVYQIQPWQWHMESNTKYTICRKSHRSRTIGRSEVLAVKDQEIGSKVRPFCDAVDSLLRQPLTKVYRSLHHAKRLHWSWSARL